MGPLFIKMLVVTFGYVIWVMFFVADGGVRAEEFVRAKAIEAYNIWY